MVTETDGIVLRQTKIPGDRRMLTLFTRKLGKISVAAGIRKNSRNKSSLPLRVFTHGYYSLYHGRNVYSLNSAETVESYFGIGEDTERFFFASCGLEFTDRILTEDVPAEGVFDLLLGFLRSVSVRKKAIKSLYLIFQWKLLIESGYMPGLDRCVVCGASDEPEAFSVPDGGFICGRCKDKLKKKENVEKENINSRLIYEPHFGIIGALKFITGNDMEKFKGLALDDETSDLFEDMLRRFSAWHLDIGKLESERYITADSVSADRRFDKQRWK